ncbi:MAG: ABC transporter ATP-binding protein [Candidatus Cyclobacteriaceae bacterium M2_1C_046]
MKELSYLNKYLIKYKYYLILGLVFTIISNIFQILPAQLVRYAINLVIDNISIYRNFEGLELQSDIYQGFTISILIYGAAILVMALLRGVFLFMVRQTIIVMSRLIEFDLKNEIFAHYQSLPLGFYRRNNTGDLMNRISEDVSKIRMYLGPSIMYGINMIILVLMLVPIMLSINVKLTLFALIPLPLLSVSIYYVNNIINKRSEEIQESQSGLSTYVQEAFSGIRILKSFNREKDSGDKFKNESDIYRDKSLALTKVQSLFFPLILGLIGLSTILTVYAGSAEVIEGSLSFGNIAEFIIYVNLLTWPVTSLGWISSIIQRAEASQKRVNEFLHTKTHIVSQKELEKPIEGKVRFDNVSFMYPESGVQALKDISFEINPGNSLAVIGTTGSGKSTIANLITRMYDATEGKIEVDDINIKDYNLISLRKQVGYVPQDVFLFSDSIYNNIAFGAEEVTEEDVIKAAKEADVYQNIKRFPKGFNTMLGERGITLSGGQKQRVSIARAVIRNPKILILDDALSAVDTKTENTILNSMKRIMKGRTSIIISHRISSAKLADKIIVLDEGKIVEKGTHDQLLEKNGFYKELFDKQLQSEEIVD